MVNDYLICVGALARTLRAQETREALLEADAAEFRPTPARMIVSALNA